MASSLNNKLIKAVPWTLLDGIFNLLYSIGMVVLLGWFISPSELGLAAAAMAVAQIVESCYAGGVQESVVRAHSSHTILTDSAHTLALALSLVGMCICWMIAWPLSIAYHNHQIFWLTIAASMVLPCNASFSIPTAILSRKIRMPILTRRIMTAKIFGLLTFIMASCYHLGAWSIVLTSLASSFGSLCILFFSLKRWPRLKLRRNEASHLLRYAIVSSAGTLCWIGTVRTFALLFGYFHGIAALGNFQFAQRLVDELAALLQITVVRIGLSYFSGLKRSLGDIARAFLNGTRLLNTVAAPVYVGLALLAADVVPLFFHQRWDATVPMIGVLALSWVLVFPKILVPTVLKAQGKPSYALQFSLCQAFGALIATLATVKMSPFAAVVGWGGAQMLPLPFELYVIRKELGITVKTQIKQTFPPMIASAIMAALVWWIKRSMAQEWPILRLSSSVAAGAVCYTCLIIVLDSSLIPLVKKLIKK